jgi:TRAP-type transport system periplasmic protein
MRFLEHGFRVAIPVVCGVFVLLTASGAVQADDKTYVMKITTPTLNDAPHQLAKNFGAAVERDSGGRIKAEVYPASQLGSIPRQIEGVQFGAIQCAIIPPEFFVGIDERFEVLAAPGLVDTLENGQRLAGDPAVKKLMLGLGGAKGLHGVGLFMAQPDSLVSKAPIRHLADFEGKKIRIFASDFQSVPLKRLGSTPVAMTLGDVLPAIQQGAIDGAVLALTVDATMRYYDAAKYITTTGQPFIFSMAFISKKWFDALPADLQKIINDDALKAAAEVNPWEADFYNTEAALWKQHGEIIDLPADEQAEFIKTVASVGADIAGRNPELKAAYDVVVAAAQRTAK